MIMVIHAHYFQEVQAMERNEAIRTAMTQGYTVRFICRNPKTWAVIRFFGDYEDEVFTGKDIDSCLDNMEEIGYQIAEEMLGI